MPSLKISHKGLLLVAVPLLFELFFVAVLVSLHQQAETEVNREIKSKTIIEHANSLMVQVISSGTATGEYGFNVKDPIKSGAAIHRYNVARKQALDEFATLEPLIVDHPDQAALLKEMSDIYSSYNVLAMKVRAAFENGDRASYERTIFVFKSIRQLNDYLDEITKRMNHFIESERRIERESPVVRAQKRSQTEQALFAGIAFNVVLAFVLARFFSMDIGQRLAVIDYNTRQLSRGQPLKPRLAGDDEIANVDKVFHEMVDKLKQVEQLKREFVSMVSHDLRTPLTSLRALLSVLEAGILSPEKTKERVQDAELDIDRLIKLINDLIEMEKMEIGNLNLNLTSVPIQKVIKRSINSVQAMAEAKSIRIEANGAEARVKADEDRLVQVLVNILSNAIKFSPDHSSIEINTVTAVSNFVEVRVSDRGRGIPAHLKEAIFDRFQQVEASDAKEQGGSGLGLAICRSIIDGHGGEIGVQSEEGEGSTFWFRIPVAPDMVV